MRATTYILIAMLAMAALTVGAQAGPKLPAPGTRARQVLLKQALDKELAGTLVSDLNSNRKEWESKKPEQLRQLRNRYYAYLRLSDARQAKLLEVAAELDRLSDEQRKAFLERARWLAKVVAGLTPAQRAQLKKLPPAERAKRLLELKAKLPESQPTTRPATSAPAK